MACHLFQNRQAQHFAALNGQQMPAWQSLKQAFQRERGSILLVSAWPATIGRLSDSAILHIVLVSVLRKITVTKTAPREFGDSAGFSFTGAFRTRHETFAIEGFIASLFQLAAMARVSRSFTHQGHRNNKTLQRKSQGLTPKLSLFPRVVKRYR